MPDPSPFREPKRSVPFPARPEFLMCRPTYFRIAYEINPWMSLRRPAEHTRAVRQWQTLHRTLTKTLGVNVRLLPPKRGLPDLVFTANAGLICGDRLIRSNFRYPERQGEEPVMDAFAEKLKLRVLHLPARYKFEGEGDALWLGDTLVYGFRFRSDAPVHERLSRIVGARVLPVELVDDRFYHLDTCFCPLDARTVLWYPKAFDRYGRRVIEGLAAETITVPDKDARAFVCNAIVVGKSVVMQAGASKPLLRQIERRGFDVYPVDLSEFLKAGGSAKCLVLKLGSKS